MTTDNTQSASDTDVTRYKDIIKMSDTYTFITGEVYYSQEAVDKQIEAVLDRLESQVRRADDCTEDTLVVKAIRIEAERNKLNEE